MNEQVDRIDVYLCVFVFFPVLYSVVIVKQLIGKRSRASGQSNLTQECIAATDARFSGIRQVAPMWACGHIGATW